MERPMIYRGNEHEDARGVSTLSGDSARGEGGEGTIEERGSRAAGFCESVGGTGTRAKARRSENLITCVGSIN